MKIIVSSCRNNIFATEPKKLLVNSDVETSHFYDITNF